MAGGEVAIDAQSKAKLDKLMATGAKDKASAVAIAKQIAADPKLLKLLPPNEQAVMKQLAGM